MKPLLALTFLVSFAASAANLDCSIKASKTTKKADMPGMAKVSVDDAKKTALGAVNASGAAITKGGLEVEDGCLVYSYDVKIPGKNGIEEVIVDAGSGKVLKTEHEGSVKEALEKTVDTMKK
jgi:uncharacterized membrane protein YkoI